MAIESNSWPTWLRNLWPTWLEDIDYPAPGVGDLLDLKLSLGVGQDGRWIGFINTGWFYHANTEQYNYVAVGTTIVTAVSGSGSVQETISFRPSWGPVLAYSATGYQQYREHHNSFYPAHSLTWSAVTGSTAYLQATLPTSSLLVSLRNLTNFPMGSVLGSSLVTSPNLFYYDLDNNRVVIKPADPTDLTPDVWADVIFTYPQLKFREVVVADKDASGNAKLYPTYNQINNVTAFRGTSTVLVSGYHASGGISHSLSVNKGDWVVLDYWIAKSYVLLDHRTVKYFCGGASGSGAVDTFVINYETSIPDTLNNIYVTAPATGIYPLFNVNPLFESGYRTGYLFHGTPASSINSYWTATKIFLNFEKNQICRDWLEPTKAKIIVYGDNDLPLPYYNVSVTVSGGSSILKLPESRTDGRGEMHYYIRPHANSSSINVTAICGTLTITGTVSVVASSSLISASDWYSGFVHMVVTNDRTGTGGFRTFFTASMADGLPRSNNTFLVSEKSSEFKIKDSNTLTQKVNVSTSLGIPNLQAISEVSYTPQSNDSLFGYSLSAISKIVRGEA